MGLLSTFGAASGRAYGFTRSAIAAATDAYFNLVTLLLPGNGTNGAQNNTFLDSSTNNFTITRNGNTTQGTFTPFSPTGWSNFFAGGSDYLYAPSNAAFGFSGSWSVEGMVYFTGTPSQNYPTGDYADYIIDFRSGDTTNAFMGVAKNGSGNLVLWGGWNGTENLGTNTLALNTWYYVAFVYNGSTFRGYVNGVQEFSQTITRTTGTNSPTIGARYSRAEGYLTGYLSNLRVVTSAVTPSTPTSPLTAIAGTVLLTCQSNRFLDNSNNAFAITVGGGTPSVQAFSPFAPTAAYSAATNGGSGYFDGSGDYLTVANNTAVQLAGTSWTVECWIYPTVLGGAAYRTIMGKRQNLSGEWELGLDTSDFIYFWNGTARTGTIKPTLNAWNHVAATHDGTNLRMFVNGALAFGPTAVTLTNTTDSVGIGAVPGGGQPITGYLSNCRVTKGGALYTAAFTPPTAPFTTTVGSGTVSLLANFTNGGIIDATGKNVLETAGGVQISTTQSKFGGSSMYFDGTGDYLTTYDPTYKSSLGSGDWTFECWVYVVALPASSSVPTAFYHLKNDSALATTVFVIELSNTGAINLSTGTSLIASGTAGKITTGSWIHFACVRYNGTIKTYFNGTSDISVANTTTYNGSYVQIGAWRYSGYDYSLNGYMDDVRITKYARYTANFTPPTAAFALQ